MGVEVSFTMENLSATSDITILDPHLHVCLKCARVICGIITILDIADPNLVTLTPLDMPRFTVILKVFLTFRTLKLILVVTPPPMVVTSFDPTQYLSTLITAVLSLEVALRCVLN